MSHATLRSIGLALAMLVPLAAPAAELWRWNEPFGQIRYGLYSDIPERYRDQAEPASTPLPPDMPACLVRWHRYVQSQACFDAYRLVGGGLKPEAFQRCTELTQPEPCN